MNLQYLKEIINNIKQISIEKNTKKISIQDDEILDELAESVNIINSKISELTIQSDYKKVFDLVPLSIWIFDFSEVKKQITILKQSGISNFSKFFNENMQKVYELLTLVKILDVNKHTVKQFQADSKEQLLTSLDLIIIKESFPLVINQLVRIAEDKTEYIGEGVNKKITGEQFNVYLSWTAIDTTYSEVIVTSFDITDKKKFEQELIDNEKKFRTITASANDAIIMIDDKSDVTLWNKAAEKIFGYTKNEILGKKLYSILAKDGMQERFKKGFLNFVKTGKGPLIGNTRELVAMRKGGEKFPIEISLSAIYLKEKWHGLSIIRDISVRKQNEIEINRNKEQVSLINKILRHDITNNLSSIRSAIDIYIDEKDDSILNEIKNYVDKSAELIEKMKNHELLITSDKLSMYDTKDIFEKITKHFQSTEISINGRMNVFADESIYSVIDNIINNAIIHGNSDKIEITISAKNDLCMIQIADNGISIPDEIKDFVFNEGFSYGEKANTGLGLCIVKEAVDKWGGFVIIDDNKPKGTIIKLYLMNVR